MRRFIMSFGSTPVDEEAGAGAGGGEGGGERGGAGIGVGGEGMVGGEGGEGEGRAICIRLLIWKEEIDVKDIVDLHRWGESEFVCDRADFLCDREGSIPFGRELLVPSDREIPSFEPDLVTFFHLRSFLIVSSVLDVGQQLLRRLSRLF